MDSSGYSQVQESTFAALVKATKAARILAAEDITFNRSLDSEFNTSLNKTSQRILSLVNSLVKSATEGSHVNVEKLDDSDSLETAWPAVVEVFDFLLEKAVGDGSRSQYSVECELTFF